MKNTNRWQLQSSFVLPKVAFTKTPSLDPVMLAQCSKSTKLPPSTNVQCSRANHWPPGETELQSNKNWCRGSWLHSGVHHHADQQCILPDFDPPEGEDTWRIKLGYIVVCTRQRRGVYQGCLIADWGSVSQTCCWSPGTGSILWNK